MFGHPWWLVLLAAIGVFAIGALILGLFSNLGEDPAEATITARPRVDSADFLAAAAGTTNAPILEGGSARLLENGDEFFPAIYAALEGAKRSINLMVYIWEPGVVSDRLFDIMVERARAGVEVRVMADGMGCRPAPKERIQELERAGGKWSWFHPLRFGQLTYFHKRNHRRAIVVDGEIGFTGGAAVADKWMGKAQDAEHWRDAVVEVRGPMAAALQPAFVQLWSQHTSEILVGPAFFPPEHAKPETPSGDGAQAPCHINFLGTPSTDDTPLRRIFRLSFHAAEESIYVTNPYFVPDRATREILMERARAGIDVRVLVPNEHNDVFLIRWASHSYYEELLEQGVRIYEFQPTMIHQKHLVVDTKWAVVGSANMDVRSEELNQECVVGILDERFAASVRDSFFQDLERAREIRLDDWRRRPAWRKLPERFFRLFEEQF
jgi:cardiolipin synthase A/B